MSVVPSTDTEQAEDLPLPPVYTTSTRLNEALAGMAAPLLAEHADLIERRAAVAKEIETIDADIRRVVKVLRAVGVEPPESPGVRSPGRAPGSTNDGGQKPRKQKAGRTSVADWRTDAVVAHLGKEDNRGGCTVTETAESLGWNKATAAVAFEQAREAGRIRIAGYTNATRPDGKRGARARLFKVVP